MHTAKKNIALLVSRLDLSGGIERSAVHISNLLQANAYSVTILILDSTDFVFYPLDKKVKIVYRNLNFGITTEGNILTRKLLFFKHLFELNRTLKIIAPDIIIATEYHLAITAWLATRYLNIKILSREAHHFHSLKKNKFWSVLLYKIYPKLDGVICLNHSEKRYFDAFGCRTMIIPNYVIIQPKAETASNHLLTIGRLIDVKGLDLIPCIAEKLLEKNKNWTWTIIGTGPGFEVIKNTIRIKNLQAYIRIIQPVSYDLEAYYGITSLYILTSRFECFPNVLLEAMSYGIPCVAFDCPTGPKHIISDGEDGILAEAGNTTQMADIINILLSDHDKRINLGKNAHKNIERFSIEHISGAWNQLLEEIL